MRRVGHTAALVVAAGVLAAGAASPASPARPLPAAFSWLVPAPAPPSWKHVRLPSGGILSYPPFLSRARSDPGAASAEQHDAQGRVAIYVNATPRQNNEQVATWPTFRLHAVAEEEVEHSVHEDGRVVDVPFLGGRGSCVMDHYVTRVASHHYSEIACYVVGRHSGSVVVAAALTSLWSKEKHLLEQVVAAYRAT